MPTLKELMAAKAAAKKEQEAKQQSLPLPEAKEEKKPEPKKEVVAVDPSLSIGVEELRARIHNLANFSDDDLKGEMESLRTCLQQNPSACALLLPEDIGLCVRAVKMLYFKANAAAIAKESKPTRVSKAKLTEADNKMLDELDLDF